MYSIQLTSNINQDSILKIQLPKDFANQEVDFVLVIQPKNKISNEPKRPTGQYQGKMKMSEDFLKHLGDEFWLGGNT